MSSPIKDLSRSLREADPYSPVLVNDLLNGLNDWRNIQDIVRITFKALTDVVTAQGNSIRELERQLPYKASKTELNTGLSLKANQSDLGHVVSDITSKLERKISYEEIRSLLDDKVNRDEFSRTVSGLTPIESFMALNSSKLEMSEFQSEMYVVNKTIDEMSIELSHTRANTREIERLFDIMDTKANTAFVNTELDERPTKEAVQTQLMQKANRSEMESSLSRKADLTDVKHIHAILEVKTDVAVTENLAREVDTKANNDETLNILEQELSLKADVIQMQNLAEDLDRARIDLNQDIQSRHAQLDNSIQNTKGVLTTQIDQLSETTSRRSDGMAAKHDSLQAQHNALDNKHENLQSNHNILQNSHRDLQTAHKNLHSDHQGLQGQHSTLACNHADLASNHERLNASHGDLQRQHTTLHDNHTNLQQKAQSMDGDKASLDDLSLALNTVKSDIERFVNELKNDTFKRSKDMELGFMAKYDDTLNRVDSNLQRQIETQRGDNQKTEERINLVHSALQQQSSLQRSDNQNAEEAIARLRTDLLHQINAAQDAIGDLRLVKTERTETDQLRNLLEDLSVRKQEKFDAEADRKLVLEIVGHKVEMKDFQMGLSQARGDAEKIVQNTKDEIRLQLEVLNTSIVDRPDLAYFNRMMLMKINKEDIDKVYNNMSEMNLQLRNLCQEFETHVKSYRASTDDIHGSLNTHIRHTRESISEVNKLMLEKSNIEEIHRITDSKVSNQEMHKLFDDVYKILDSKTTIEEFRAQNSDQALINDTLCAENCVGRWIWKSGSVRNGYAVPWEIQSVNTCPENFVWEQDQTSILTVMPGLYEVTFGFFSRTRPIVNLLVNGDNVIIPAVVENCNLTGYSIHEYLALPERARIIVSYVGDMDSEGFLNVKKL